MLLPIWLRLSSLAVAHVHRGRQSGGVLLLFSLFFPGMIGKEIDSQTQNNMRKFPSVSSIWIHFMNLSSFEMFSNYAGRLKKRGVPTMFAYSHLDTTIDQWERGYYLNSGASPVRRAKERSPIPIEIGETEENHAYLSDAIAAYLSDAIKSIQRRALRSRNALCEREWDKQQDY